MKRYVFGLMFLIPFSAFTQSAFDEFVAFKKESTIGPIDSNGKLESSEIQLDDFTCVSADEKLRSALCVSIRESKEILLSAKILADREILLALGFAAKKGASICVLLENKVNLRDYKTPDYLNQSGVVVLHPHRDNRLDANILILDGISAYIFSDWEFSTQHIGNAIITKNRAYVGRVYERFCDIFKLCEPSIGTRMENPKVLEEAVERFK